LFIIQDETNKKLLAFFEELSIWEGYLSKVTCLHFTGLLSECRNLNGQLLTVSERKLSLKELMFQLLERVK